MKTVVVSAFPACGKSYLSSHNKSLKISDSDSSNFHRDGKLDIEWYVNQHIKNAIGKYDYIFVSSHLDVRRKLEQEGIEYVTVYPKMESKHSFLKRMKNRGNNETFIKLLTDNWDTWVSNIEKEPHGKKLLYLDDNEYLSDLYDRGEL